MQHLRSYLDSLPLWIGSTQSSSPRVWRCNGSSGRWTSAAGCFSSACRCPSCCLDRSRVRCWASLRASLSRSHELAKTDWLQVARWLCTARTSTAEGLERHQHRHQRSSKGVRINIRRARRVSASTSEGLKGCQHRHQKGSKGVRIETKGVQRASRSTPAPTSEGFQGNQHDTIQKFVSYSSVKIIEKQHTTIKGQHSTHVNTYSTDPVFGMILSGGPKPKSESHLL